MESGKSADVGGLGFRLSRALRNDLSDEGGSARQVEVSRSAIGAKKHHGKIILRPEKVGDEMPCTRNPVGTQPPPSSGVQRQRKKGNS